MRGHITKRGDSWTAVVDLPADPVTGKRRQKRITTRTKREVELQIAALIQATETGYTDAGNCLCATTSTAGSKLRPRRCELPPRGATGTW